MLPRIRDLVSANLNTMLNRAEDPEKMVNEYTRPLTTNLNEAKISVASAMADETKLHRNMVEQPGPGRPVRAKIYGSSESKPEREPKPKPRAKLTPAVALQIAWLLYKIAMIIIELRDDGTDV